MYILCTRMIFATVLSPTIKIFHRHLGHNLYIFAVKVSPWFHRHFMTYHRHFTTKKPWPSWFRAKSRCAYCISSTLSVLFMEIWLTYRYGTAWVFGKCFFKLWSLELKKWSEFFPFFLVTVLPHTLNKRITVYNVDK